MHDPEDRQLAQALRVLPLLQEIYDGIVVCASEATSDLSLQDLQAAGVRIDSQRSSATLATLGEVRRHTLALALQHDAAHLHLCDWDRIIHWGDFYPNELREVVAAIPGFDCLILGRTERAFNTHPRVQRDTEQLINHCFGLAWGQALDVTAASRGLSQRAAELIVAQCDEQTIGNDCVWPLFLARQNGILTGYVRTEGLEWETPDRFADEIAAAGGLDSWLADHDADVARWAMRLDLARVEVDALRRWQFTR